MRRLVIALANLAFTAAPALGDTIHVPGDQPTIQAAIDAAAPGDEIVIAAGTYSVAEPHVLPQGGLSFQGVGEVVLTGSGGAFFDVLDPQDQDLFRFEHLRFVTNNIGIRTSVPSNPFPDTHLEVVDCTFVDNNVGISARNTGNLEVADCRFEGGGMGIYMLYAWLHAQDCVFLGTEEMAIYGEDGPPQRLVERCLFADCMAAAVSVVWDYHFTCRQCTFVHCGRPYGAAISAGGVATIVLDRCIVVDGPGRAFACSENERFTITCSNIWNNAAGDWSDDCAIGGADENGNFSADPLFCNASAGDYTIDASSPCTASGNACGVIVGAYDVGCGVTGIPELPSAEASSLSAIKSRY